MSLLRGGFSRDVRGCLRGAAGFPFAGLNLVRWGVQAIQHRVDRGHADAGETAEAGASPQAGGREGLGHGGGTFTVKALL